MPAPRIDAALEAAEPIELLAELVRIPSHRGIERQEAAVATALADYLTAGGLEPELREVVPGRPNVMCTVEAQAPGRHLLLCGHTDTVPLNATDPGVGFSGRVRDGMLEGRGAVDMKGALAAMAATLVALARAEALPAGRVTLAAVIDEEMESLGAEHLVTSRFTADGAIVGEPSQNLPCLGHKGLEWLEIVFRGRAAHGGTPTAGVNAIDAAALFVHAVRTRLLPRFAQRADPLLGPPTLNFGTIEGGDQPSTVADRSRLTADRRSVPGETYATICAELEELLDGVRGEMPGIETALGRMEGGMATLEHVALKTDPGAPIALAAAAAWERVRGTSPEFGAFPAWTDAALLAAFGDIPSIIMGPGDITLAHSPREAVPVAQVREATELYARTALEFCGAHP